jgi:hypothetical protein
MFLEAMMTVYVTKVRGLRFRDGVAGGAIAGLIHSIVVVIYGLIDGSSMWQIPNLITNLIGITPTSSTEFGALTLLGFGLNIAVLTLLGGLFTLAAKQAEGKVLLWSALVYGVIVWAIGYWIILPVFAPLLHDGLAVLTALSGLLVYGSVLGAYLMRRQRRELVDRY